MGTTRTGARAQDGTTTALHWRRDRLFDEQLTRILFEKCQEQTHAVVTALQTKPASRWFVWHRRTRAPAPRGCRRFSHATRARRYGAGDRCRRPLPLTTVELQKAGASKLRITSDQMMTVRSAASLWGGGGKQAPSASRCVRR